jgi:hypothetical protein
MADGDWNATVTRVRGEFDEMPALRVTEEQARVLFGLPTPASKWVLTCLERNGFLDKTPQGEYIRRNPAP